jgi:hypothetical protein
MLPSVADQTYDNFLFGLDRACISVNGLWIAADSAAECEDHSAFLTTLANRRPGVSMQEIHDTLTTMLADDLADDNQEALDALTQMQRDEEAISAIWARGPTTIELVAIADHYRTCVEWFATHAHDPVVRQRMMAALAEHEALRAENAETAMRQLASERRKLNGHAS